MEVLVGRKLAFGLLLPPFIVCAVIVRWSLQFCSTFPKAGFSIALCIRVTLANSEDPPCADPEGGQGVRTP